MELLLLFLTPQRPQSEILHTLTLAVLAEANAHLSVAIFFDTSVLPLK